MAKEQSTGKKANFFSKWHGNSPHQEDLHGRNTQRRCGRGVPWTDRRSTGDFTFPIFALHMDTAAELAQ